MMYGKVAPKSRNFLRILPNHGDPMCSSYRNSSEKWMSAVFQGASTKDFRIPFPIRLLQDAPGRNETPETPCYCPGLKFPWTAPPKAQENEREIILEK